MVPSMGLEEYTRLSQLYLPWLPLHTVDFEAGDSVALMFYYLSYFFIYVMLSKAFEEIFMHLSVGCLGH